MSTNNNKNPFNEFKVLIGTLVFIILSLIFAPKAKAERSPVIEYCNVLAKEIENRYSVKDLQIVSKGRVGKDMVYCNYRATKITPHAEYPTILQTMLNIKSGAYEIR